MRLYRRFGGVLRVAGTSWLMVALGLGLLAAVGVVTVRTVSGQSQKQVLRAATEEARVISRVTAHRDVGADDVGHHLSRVERRDLNGDVAQLQRGGHLRGLAVIGIGGQLLYREGRPPIPAVADPRFRTAASGDTSADFFQPGGGDEQIEVLLPMTVVGGTRPEFVVAVTMPAAKIRASTTWANRLLTAGAALLLAVIGIALVAVRRRMRQREHDANHDVLTGLGNHTKLATVGDRLLARGRPFALVRLNLQGFRRVNDALGRAAGDELLVQVGAAIQRHARRADTVCRLGGDEFALILPDVDAEWAEAAGRHLLDAASAQFTVQRVLVDTDACVGIATAPKDATSTAELLQAADVALTEAKAGHLGLVAYSGAGAEPSTSDLQLLAELRAAIGGGELQLYYQPTLALRPGVEPAVEALVRWQHPVHGLIPPDRFIPLAEGTALIYPLTEWVLDEAIRQCAQWRLDGLPVTVAVNISPRSLTHHGLIELVTDALARHQLPASALHLEVTESAIIARPELARDMLARLNVRGIAIAIDDFGAGYTSLAHLRTMPVQVLKIDRAFITDLLNDVADRAIVPAIINLAHGLGMHVIAEGVEDHDTLSHLSQLGCDIAQGYHIAKPEPADQTTNWLRANPPHPARLDAPLTAGG
jgi:diguanylate cyclase (GGDEF)-like protein